MSQFLVSGSLAYDRIMDYRGVFSDHILPDKIHDLNVAFLLDTLQQEFGGNAGNIAYTLQLLGETSDVIGCVGNDFDRYAKRLHTLGVGHEATRLVPEQVCSVAHIFTDSNGNQITGFYPGAQQESALLDNITRERVVAKLADTDYAIIGPGNEHDMVGLAELYRKHQVKYIADPGQQITALSGEQLRELITGAFMLTVNDYEYALVQQQTGWSEDDIKAQCEHVVVTRGKEGATWWSKGAEQIVIPVAEPKQVADPTGAGDAYRAGLLKGLRAGWSRELTGKVAALCATYAIEQHGTQVHEFTKEEFQRRFTDVFAEEVTL